MGDLPIILLIIFIVFLPILIILILCLVGKNKTPVKSGRIGEAKVAAMLEDIRKRNGGFIINDITIPAPRGRTQIDHIYFSNAGVFVIETKNHSGEIIGNENDKKWTQVLSKKNGVLFDNPVKQNNYHVAAVNKVLNFEAPVIPMVVFVRAEIIGAKSNQVYSMSFAKQIIENSEKVLTDEEVRWAYNRIISHRCRNYYRRKY